MDGVKLPECINCGKEFVKSREKDELCFPCELAVNALKPPQILKDMRVAYSGGSVGTAGEIAMKDLFVKDVVRFTDRMTKLEDQYRAAVVKWEHDRRMKSSAVKWDGQGVCPSCGRGTAAEVVKDASTGALIGKVEQWLKKRNAG